MVANVESCGVLELGACGSGGREPDPAWSAAIEWAQRQFDPAAVERRMDAKRRARAEAIDALHARRIHGDRMVCTLLYDSEHAAMTTNLQQVLALGVDLVSHDPACPTGRLRRVALVVVALAWHDIYLSCTDHLDDDALHQVLFETVLQDPVRDLPGGAQVHEWIDLATVGSDGLEERWLSWYASEHERTAREGDGEVLPPIRRRTPSRDAALPRPTRP